MDFQFLGRKVSEIICILGILLLVPVQAYAHPTIERGVRAYQRADFQAALDAFVEAEGRSDLSTQDLLKLLEWRALVHSALNDGKKMREDLRRLASIRPTYRLGPLAPPPVRVAFDTVREAVEGAIRIDMSVQALPGRLRVILEIKRDVTQIGRELRVFTRQKGSKTWKKSIGERAVVSLPNGARVEYYAELVGPGGAVITSSASATAPRLADVPPGPDAIKKRPKFKAPKSALISWYAGGGVLLSGAAIGTYAFVRDRKFDKGCGAENPPNCDPKQTKRVETMALVADVMYGLGAAGVITGTVLYFKKRKEFNKKYKDLAPNKSKKKKKGGKKKTDSKLKSKKTSWNLTPIISPYFQGASAQVRF